MSIKANTQQPPHSSVPATSSAAGGAVAPAGPSGVASSAPKASTRPPPPVPPNHPSGKLPATSNYKVIFLISVLHIKTICGRQIKSSEAFSSKLYEIQCSANKQTLGWLNSKMSFLHYCLSRYNFVGFFVKQKRFIHWQSLKVRDLKSPFFFD